MLKSPKTPYGRSAGFGVYWQTMVASHSEGLFWGIAPRPESSLSVDPKQPIFFYPTTGRLRGYLSQRLPIAWSTVLPLVDQARVDSPEAVGAR